MAKGMLICLISMKKDFFFEERDHLYDTTNLLLIFLFFWEKENIIEQFLNFNIIIKVVL